ncbi:MAG: hypothetical protein K8S99_04540 [Planctomycetes bacterium]|nr:hypothetical protein [Planctomycetota bacterium]
MNGRQEQDRRDGWTPDDSLEPLLDEALDASSLPGGVPAGLGDRVLAATAHRLDKPGVLARIGPRGWSAVAACVAMALSLGIWVNVPLNTATPGGGTPTTLAHNDEATLKREINALAEYNGPSDAIDHDLTLLAMKFDRHDLPETTDTYWTGDDDAEADSVDPSGGALF